MINNSLERILLLGGLNLIQAIWLQTYSKLCHLLSSRLGKTLSTRIVLFCCCNSWRLFFLRRLRTYASGSYFIRHHIFMLFWSYLGCPGAPSGALWALLGRSLAPRGPLLDAQAAQIRVRRFCCMFVYTSGAYILCAGCGDPGLVSFWPLPGTVPGISGASFICAGCVDPRAAFFLWLYIHLGLLFCAQAAGIRAW